VCEGGFVRREGQTSFLQKLRNERFDLIF